MELDQAIAILEQQREKLKTVSSKTYQSWQTQTKSFIKDFFGENSSEYEHINGFHFVWGTLDDYEGQVRSSAPYMVQFVGDCIETLRVKGLFNHPTPESKIEGGVHYHVKTEGNQSPVIQGSSLLDSPTSHKVTTTPNKKDKNKPTAWYSRPLFTHIIWPVIAGLIIAYFIFIFKWNK